MVDGICFSSSCANGQVLVELDINDYHRRRPKLRRHDVSAKSEKESWNVSKHCSLLGSNEKLKAQIDRSPSCSNLGFLHHGSVSAPTGGGHYILAIGLHRHSSNRPPYGELDVVNGGYRRKAAPTAKRFATAGKTGHPGGQPITTGGALMSGWTTRLLPRQLYQLKAPRSSNPTNKGLSLIKLPV